MTLQCTAEMAGQVVAAMHCVRQRLWRRQPNLVWLDVSQAEDVLRACLEYLCGDTVYEAAITRLVVPSPLDVQHTARLYPFNQQIPDLPQWRLEFEPAIDGQRSDLTFVFHVYQRAECVQVLLYDVLVQ